MKLLHWDETDGRLAGKRGLVIWTCMGKLESLHLILTWTARRKEWLLFDYDNYVAKARRMWWLRLEWQRRRGLTLYRGVHASHADTPNFAAPHKTVRLVPE
jgi:hypothetical protein